VSHAIHGTGLVSPIGLTPREHAFYLPALLPPPAASPFVGPKDEPLPVKRCIWLGASAPVAGRLAALAIQAARSALAPLSPHPEVTLGLLFCADAPRPGLTDVDVREAEEALVRVVSPAFVVRVRAAGGPFGALEAALERAKHARVDGLLVVAADSLVSLDFMTHRYVTRRPAHWCGWPPAPSEAGAAALLVSPEAARRWSLRPLGTVRTAGVAAASSCDDDDEIVDGAALTGIVRRCAGSRVHYVFGQGAVDDLRGREWLLAMARNAEVFRAGHSEYDLERSVGSIGVAAGLANLVYGVAALRHHTLDATWPRTEPFLAWHITRDGMRGGASVAAETS
jgi:hypothetical protein